MKNLGFCLFRTGVQCRYKIWNRSYRTETCLSNLNTVIITLRSNPTIWIRRRTDYICVDEWNYSWTPLAVLNGESEKYALKTKIPFADSFYKQDHYYFCICYFEERGEGGRAGKFNIWRWKKNNTETKWNKAEVTTSTVTYEEENFKHITTFLLI